MNKLLLTLALVLFVVALYGQTLQKGNLIGTHVLKLEMKPGVTIKQFQEFYINKLIPAIEKARSGWKVYLVKGVRGENKDSYGLIVVIESVEAHDKHYNADDSLSEFGKEALRDYNPVKNELDKLVTISSKFTDWLVL